MGVDPLWCSADSLLATPEEREADFVAYLASQSTSVDVTTVEQLANLRCGDGFLAMHRHIVRAPKARINLPNSWGTAGQPVRGISTGATGHTSWTRYDANGQVSSKVGADGNITTLTRNPRDVSTQASYDVAGPGADCTFPVRL